MYHECLFARLFSGEGDDSSFSPLSSFHGLKKKTEEKTGQNWANEVNKQSSRGE